VQILRQALERSSARGHRTAGGTSHRGSATTRTHRGTILGRPFTDWTSSRSAPDSNASGPGIGRRNSVTAVDLDWILTRNRRGRLWLMLQRNGHRPLVKTAGENPARRRTRRNAWARAVGTSSFRDPECGKETSADPSERSIRSGDVVVGVRALERSRRGDAQLLARFRREASFYVGIILVHGAMASRFRHEHRLAAPSPWAQLRRGAQLVRRALS